jgi:hypothetical protein
MSRNDKRGRKAYGPKGAQVKGKHARGRYNPDRPDATLETVYGERVPEVFRAALARGR